MNIKRIAASVVLMSGLVTSAFSFADASMATSGVVNVDHLRPQTAIEAKGALMTRSATMSASTTSKQSAGGGTFWVDWGTKNGSQAYRSNYEHEEKTHKTSVVNRYHNDSSGWVSPGVLAQTDYIYSTFSGNKAYWDTK